MVCISLSGGACTNTLIPSICLFIYYLLGGECRGWKVKSQEIIYMACTYVNIVNTHKSYFSTN